jgi:biotin carboxyl carrier protein
MSATERALRLRERPGTGSPDDEPVTIEQGAAVATGHRTIVGQIGAMDPAGRRALEVVVDGWRFEFDIEDDARAELRERASRERSAGLGAGEPLEIRAIIPGRIASVAVTAGDLVEQGQTLLAVEAMKMQNELRAPRAGTVSRVAAAAGTTVELGDLLVVLE